LDGQDVRAVYASAARAVARARRGEGPSFLLCTTYRYYGHHVGDVDRAYYRPREEEARWKAERDPISLLRDRLVADGIVDEGELAQIEREVTEEVAAAAEHALDAPFPQPDEVDEDVYA
jgi:pyruvate dehydrogenase E1 component alpha subunit